MILGILFALGACLLWGTIFVIPQFLPEFSSLEVALGRYFFYGLFSALLLIKKFPRQSLRTWSLAFFFGLVANVIYYIGIVIGVRFATPPVTVLVVGMCPVMAALYGNLHSREFSFRGLLLSCFVMVCGIVLVNVTEIDWSFGKSSLKEYMIGMAGAIVALLTWAHYAVQNAKFLKANPELPRTEWATMIGVSTLFWVILLTGFLTMSSNEIINLQKFVHYSPQLGKFLLCTAFLGIACAWVGCYWWNKASSLVPISIIGPLIIFETLFGLLCVFLYEMRMPTAIEFTGITAMLGGVLLCFALPRKETVEIK